MGTRVENYKKRRKEKRIKRFKIYTISILICGLIIGIKIVNNRARDLDCLTNSNILYYDFHNNSLEVFGKIYYLDFSKLKNIF